MKFGNQRVGLLLAIGDDKLLAELRIELSTEFVPVLVGAQGTVLGSSLEDITGVAGSNGRMVFEPLHKLNAVDVLDVLPFAFPTTIVFPFRDLLVPRVPRAEIHQH
ncbi:hypothetical protein D9M72_457100 [compost metagenome]